MSNEHLLRWEIRDESGALHTGEEDEMREAWDVMTLSSKEWKEKHPDGTWRAIADKWMLDWEGDLELIQVHAVDR